MKGTENLVNLISKALNRISYLKGLSAYPGQNC